MNRKTFLDSSSDSSSDDEFNDRKYRIVVIGPRECGKTSLIQRIQSDYFSIQYKATDFIEIHNGVKMGDIEVDIWDVPPNICKYYNVSTLTSDAILVVFDSDKDKSLEEAVSLWNILHEKLYKTDTPEMWFVHRGAAPVRTEYCHPDRVFQIDNLSKDGILDLIYDVRCKLLRKY